MQKAILIILLLGFWLTQSYAQPSGYYNGTSGKDGDELKAALHDIIKDHTPYSYYYSKYIFVLSDADPNNPDNIVQFYTGFSHDNSDYGNSNLQLNREHVWAKSHGFFEEIPVMNGDVHNLKPTAAAVNQDKSNLDFDNGGTQHDIATGCFFTDSTWEARDEVKGDVARIIFYMSTRYEGDPGELDLEVVDWNNTYPNAQHGKLSTLLQWNLMDPPDAFERNRNDVIYSYQKNRNPFIDNPEFVQLIWGDETVSPLSIDNVHKSPEVVVAEQPVEVIASITNSSKTLATATLRWGLSYESLPNEILMEAGGETYLASIPGQPEDATIYYQITAVDGQEESSTVVYNYYIPKIFTGTIISIYDIQGQQEDSPYDGQVVSTTGVVTANFGDSYFIQDGFGSWNGLYIYESGRNPSVGDSIILTGEVSEYAGTSCETGVTEMSYISDYYFISANNELPEPLIVMTGGVSEEHEGVLCKIVNATCTFADYQQDYYMWRVNDGTGELKIHNTSVFEYDPTLGVSYNITGPMNWSYCEWKVELRFESDVSEGIDEEKPYVAEVTPVTSTNIMVNFSEPVETTTAENLANYQVVGPGSVIESISQHAFDKSQVNITITELYGEYELTVENVADEVGNVMEPQTIPFSWLGINEQFLNANVSIYPNPATNHFVLTITPLNDFDEELLMSVYNVAGQSIIEKEYIILAGLNSFEVNTSTLDKGLYFIKLSTADNSGMQKLMIK